jgi:hypothetical protein
VQAIFDLPVLPNAAQELLVGSCPTTDEVTHQPSVFVGVVRTVVYPLLTQYDLVFTYPGADHPDAIALMDAPWLRRTFLPSIAIAFPSFVDTIAVSRS